MSKEEIIQELEAKIYDIMLDTVTWDEIYGVQGMGVASREITEYIIKSELLTKIKTND